MSTTREREYTLAEFADEVGYSPDHAKRLWLSGKVRGRQIAKGHAVFIPQREVDRIRECRFRGENTAERTTR